MPPPLFFLGLLFTLLPNPVPFTFVVSLNPHYNVNSSNSSVNGVNTEDKAALLEFKSQIQDPFHSLSNWDQIIVNNGNGIVTFSNLTGRVTALNLTALNLSGQIHSSLCNLFYLETLVLSRNAFYGSIPFCFNLLQNLKMLDLSHNGFTGEIPLWIGNFSLKLEKLDLGFNEFSGEMPTSLYYLMSLKFLDLSQNYLKGKLGDFGQELVYLNLEHNLISGTLPCFLSSNQSLTILNLANNSIIGGIPACISSCVELRQLNLSYNQLQYGISPRLIFSEKLVVLDLSFNLLMGNLPREVVDIPRNSELLLLDLSHNQFTGNVPEALTEIKSLQALFLSHNFLTGEITERIGNLTYIQVIDLSYNMLSGSIPLNIVGCFQLQALKLNNNNLSGELQPELDALDSLRILGLSNNQISGEIPLTLAGCKSLEVVDLSSNNLSGSLNDAITKWTNLRFLSLSNNKFNGIIPSWVFTFDAMQTMDLSSNKFSGYIPDDNFNISWNFNHGRTKFTTPLSLSSDFINLQVKVVFGDKTEMSFKYDLSTAVGIDISNNLLHGEIPGGFFGLQGIEYFNLSYNLLDGEIPNVSKMLSLEILDLSHNSFSGSIPENISVLGNLTLLNLSYNCLSGVISTRQGYLKFPGAFAGNPDLCLESNSDGCKGRGISEVESKGFRYENEGGIISIWVFCITAFVSFYIGVVALCCSAQMRNYILRTKA